MFNLHWSRLIATSLQLAVIITPLHTSAEPLILTPYIEEHRLEDARKAAEVHLEDFQNVSSYSGYLTVDEKNNGSLFFWYFPSQQNYKKDPVLLWLQGGPGSSSLYGLFVEHGPFTVTNGKVSLRKISWYKNHSIIYIDQPVQTGFSFTNGPLVSNETQVGEHLYTALVQFFTIFFELQSNAFFVTGESYAGKYVPSISYAIHTKNPTADLKINLQGLLIGSGFIDPPHQLAYGKYAYQIGLIDKNTLGQIEEVEENATRSRNEGDYEYATYYSNTVINNIVSAASVKNIYNFLKDVDDSPMEWRNFIVQNRVREALHVGNRNFTQPSPAVYEELYEDICKSVAPWLSELLGHYRVLLFNGQLGLIDAYALTVNFLQNFEFSSSKEYATAERKIWYFGKRVAGYVKSAGNLTEVLVRNAGHIVVFDQPEVAYDLLYNFVRNKKLV